MTEPLHTVNAEILDMRGVACPLPIVRLNQAIRRLAAGEMIRFITTDCCSERNLRAYLGMSGHRLVAKETGGPEQTFWLTRRGDEPIADSAVTQATRESLELPVRN
jgi:TusA-related sulfurtransferase